MRSDINTIDNYIQCNNQNIKSSPNNRGNNLWNLPKLLKCSFTTCFFFIIIISSYFWNRFLKKNPRRKNPRETKSISCCLILFPRIFSYFKTTAAKVMCSFLAVCFYYIQSYCIPLQCSNLSNKVDFLWKKF